MDKQKQIEADTEAVRSMHHCGDPEMDHLIDDIKHPGTEEALWEMASRRSAE